MKLAGKKIGVLIESDFYEKEIFYYEHRFPEEGAELHFMTRLWGQPSITFRGHEEKYPFECRESFEGMDDQTLASYSAIIVPSGMVSDRLRYTEDVKKDPAGNRVPQARIREQADRQGHHLPRLVADGAGARTGARPAR